MTAIVLPGVTGWERLALLVGQDVPAEEIDAIWTFPAVRRERLEWGTAIVSRVSGARRRIYTARYALAIKGKERGKFQGSVEEVGSGPLEALDELLREVRRRTDDERPLEPVPVAQWFPTSGVAAAEVAELTGAAAAAASATPPEQDDGTSLG